MAIQWVVDNVAQFKGNPNLITLGGLMGGGVYVPMHMVSPSSKGTQNPFLSHNSFFFPFFSFIYVCGVG